MPARYANGTCLRLDRYISCAFLMTKTLFWRPKDFSVNIIIDMLGTFAVKYRGKNAAHFAQFHKQRLSPTIKKITAFDVRPRKTHFRLNRNTIPPQDVLWSFSW